MTAQEALIAELASLGLSSEISEAERNDPELRAEFEELMDRLIQRARGLRKA